jgi:hypothetical protein
MIPGRRLQLEWRLCPGCDEHFESPSFAHADTVCVACEQGGFSDAQHRRARHLALLDRWPPIVDDGVGSSLTSGRQRRRR